LREYPASGAVGPLAGAERDLTLDALRGFALLGILLINITAMGMPWQGGANPAVYGGAADLNLWTFLATEVAVEGAMRALFSGLFGAGFLLLLDRLEARTQGLRGAEIYARRLLALALFGLIDGYWLLWTGDILYTYAVVGFFLLPFRSLRPGWLVGLAAALVLLQALGHWAESQALTAQHAAHVRAEAADGETVSPGVLAEAQAWRAYRDEVAPDAETLAGVIAQRRGPYLDQLASHGAYFERAQRLLTWSGLLPALDVWPVMLLGMALLRLGLLRRTAPLRAHLWLLAMGYGVGLPVSLYEAVSFWSSGFDPLRAAQLQTTYDLGRLAMAAGHLGLFLALARWRSFAWALRALAPVGRMALSNYLLHSGLALFLFSGAGLGLYGAFERWQLYGIVLGFWAVNLLFSRLWLQRFRYGPVEWLWRSASYGALQPLSRRSPGSGPAAP